MESSSRIENCIDKFLGEYGGEVKGELCTPTGAALLKHFAAGFGNMPAMCISKTGYGMGKKDFERANCVRVMVGESAEDDGSKVCELCCNVDDMTGEETKDGQKAPADTAKTEPILRPQTTKHARTAY